MSSLKMTNRVTPPDTPETGKVKIYIKGNAPHWRTDDGVEHSLSVPVFGQHVDLSTFDDYTTTTSGSYWDTYTGLQIPSNVVGTFLVMVTVYARMNTTGGDSRVRLSHNGSTVGEYWSEEFKDQSSAQRVVRSFMKKVVVSGNDYLDLDFATERSGDTMTIYEGSLVLWRIS